MNTMWFAKPADGYAYSPVELGAIDELADTEEESAAHRLKRHEYFRRIGDTVTTRMLERAILAELREDLPAWAETWDEDVDDIEAS